MTTTDSSVTRTNREHPQQTPCKPYAHRIGFAQAHWDGLELGAKGNEDMYAKADFDAEMEYQFDVGRRGLQAQRWLETTDRDTQYATVGALPRAAGKRFSVV